MNNINKFNLGLFIVVLILFVIVLFVTYTKKVQPTKEEAYKQGLGYYTTEESLGCVNDSLRCSEPGTETFIQYCIPNPVTGKGCISADGKQTYDTVIRQKPCNLHCSSDKFVVEDQIQVKNAGREDNVLTSVTGSGCNKVIDTTLGLDYTDFFFGDYNTTTNKYSLKSCVPEEGYAGYYQKTYTCQKADDKGDNNCVYTCGSEGNVLGLNGIFDSKTAKNLLKYFPSEIDSSGNKRYVCYDLNGVDQIETLNYFNKVPSDFIYPNICYKHTTVLNYNGELWPNSDSANVFTLPLSNYQSNSEFFSVDGTSLQSLLGSDGLVTENYNIFTDYNSYVKIYLGNEIALLNRILPAGNSNYLVNLFYNNTSAEITQRDTNYELIFYIPVVDSQGNPHKITSNDQDFFQFDCGSSTTLPIRFLDNSRVCKTAKIEPAFTVTVAGHGRQFHKLTLPKGTLSTTNQQETISNFVTYDNSLITFSFFPVNSKMSNIVLSSTPPTATLSFITAPLIVSPNVIYFEGKNSKNQNVYFWCTIGPGTATTLSSQPIGNDKSIPLLQYIEWRINIINVYDNKNPVILDDITITSPFYVLPAKQQFGTNINIYTGLRNTYVSLVLNKGFKTGNVEFNSFIPSPPDEKYEPPQEKILLGEESEVAVLKLQNKDIATPYLDGNFYSLTSGNPWTVESSDEVVNFTFVSTGKYTAVINSKTYTFTFDGSVWGVDSGTVTVTNSTLTLLDAGLTYQLNSAQNLLYTTLFYFYGINQAASETPFYYHPLMVLSNPPNSSVSFLELPDYNISSVNIIQSNVPPSNTDEFTYLDLNVTSGIADTNFEYVRYNPVVEGSDDNLYFIRNLSRRTNLGSYQLPGDLLLFNDGLLSSNLDPGSNFKMSSIKDVSYYVTQESNKNILQLIRRDSSFFENFYQISNSTYQEQKLNQYLEMISKQNDGITGTNTSDDKFPLIILPQNTVTVAADYSVFKSPYSIEEDGSYKFLCYNDNGTPKAKGTRVTLGRNQKMFFNKACNDYNTEEDATCGVIGIKAVGGGTSLTPCQQVRINQNPNFLEECLPYTQDKYNTVGNLFESGVVLRETFKAKKMGDQIDNSVNVFKDFFTREEESDKVYKPDQELYTNKNQQNFYLSLKDDNTDFVVEPSSWERVFTYQNLTKSVVYQNHLHTENQITLSTPINLGLNGSSQENLISGNFGYRMVFKNSKTGLNTQNFLYTGVQFYYDTNNGADYNIYAQNFAKYRDYTDRNFPIKIDTFISEGNVNGGEIYRKEGHDNVWTANTLGNKFLPNYGNFLLKSTRPSALDAVYIWYNFMYVTGLGVNKRLISSLNKVKKAIAAFLPPDSPFPHPTANATPTYNKGFLTSYSNNEPINVDNINTYVSKAELVKVTQEKKIENLIKFTITDNNLKNEYSNVTVGDYINIDENFFGQLFFNLLSSSTTSQVQLGGYKTSYNPSKEYPQLFRRNSTTVEGSRVLHIYGGLTDVDDIKYVRDTILSSLNGNGICKLVASGFRKNGTFKTSNIDLFVNQTNIEVFDILVFYKIYNSENPYFAKVIKIETEKDTKENIVSYTLTFQKDIKGTLSEDNLSGKGVFFNLKKSGSVIDNYYKIIDVSGGQVSFYFSIGDYTITDFQQGTGTGNIVYDSKLVNFNGDGSIYVGGLVNQQDKNKNISVPLNTFSYFISARYIKNKTQIPFQTLTENKLYVSMTRKNDSDYYDTKLLSYVTQYTQQTSDGKIFYYFKEFREDYGYDNPQVEKCFAVGDVIRYITKTGSADSYTEENIADFRVIETDAIVKSKYKNIYVNKTLVKNIFEITNRYDYKCELVSPSNLPPEISKSKVNLYTSAKLVTSPVSNDNLTYGGFSDYISQTIYQLPYVGYVGSNLASFFLLGYLNTGNKNVPYVISSTENFVKGTTNSPGIIPLDNFFLDHDYQKFAYAGSNDFYSADKSVLFNTAVGLQNNLKYNSELTYPSRYIRGNRLDVLRLVSTSLRSVKNPSTDYINIDITSLTGKAYGSEIVLNATNSDNLSPNYNRIGNITDFKISSSQIDNSEVGDIFESNKGFQLILTDEPPSEYEFVSIEKNSRIAPYETESDQIISPYNKDDIVSIIDRNVRQYFRNNTEEDSKFNFKLQQSSNFEIVPKTVYPEDAFIDFHPDTYYQKGEVVKFSSDTELSGLYQCSISNLDQPIQAANHFWTYDILTKEMKSNNQQFYSFVYPETTITKGDDLNEIITKTKELNNLNLPLEIKTFNSNQEETDYCPTYCAVGNGDKTLKQIINDSFVGKLDYFNDIKYLFENPVLIKQENNKKYLSLGNTPVTYNEKGDYNTTFLSSSNDTENLVSQFLYFLDLDNDRKIYNKPKCNQNFVHYKSDGTSINSGVSNFEFSNSLVFQFFPCDLGSQDYISYGVGENNVVTLNDTKNILWNRFPPVNGLTKSGGVSIPLISQDGDNFSGVSQTFKTTYLTENAFFYSKGDVVTLTHSGGDSVNLTVNEIGNTLEGVGVTEAISKNGTGYSYGDVWHLTPKGGTSILTYGFVVPEENGKLTDKSFIQIKDFNNNVEDCSIFINSDTGSGFCMAGVSGFNYIRDYSITKVSGTTNGIYTGNLGGYELISANIQFDSSGNVLQRNQAVASPAVTSGTSIFVPSYNVKEHIKVKALATFGSNYLANISYNNLGFRTLENKIAPTGIFNIYSNSIFSNQVATSSTNVLLANNNRAMTGLVDVMKIKFNSDKFDIQLNNFSLPINNDNSNLIQRKGINLGAVNSNSINEFTVEEIKSVVGVSVGINFNEFNDFNLDYIPGSSIIPGNTNTQIQIREIRQNRSADYIDPRDNCSLYFEPELLPTTNLDGDSIFLDSSNNSNQGGAITVTVNTLQNLYQFTSSQNKRFSLDFDSKITYESGDIINFHLGNNLTYYIDQTDKSNDGYPLVFSTSGTDFLNKNNIVSAPEKPFGGGTILVNYFLDFQEVSQAQYTTISDFNNATQNRSIKFMFRTPFSHNKAISLFYGFKKDNGQRNGGRFNVIYH